MPHIPATITKKFTLVCLFLVCESLCNANKNNYKYKVIQVANFIRSKKWFVEGKTPVN